MAININIFLTECDLRLITTHIFIKHKEGLYIYI